MEKKETLWTNMKRTWKYAKTEKKSIIAYTIISVIEGIISVVLPLITAQVILNITDGVFKQLFYTSVMILILEVILYFMYYLKSYFFNLASIRVKNSLQSAVTEETLKLEVREIDQASSGIFIDRLNQDTTEISEVFMDVAYWISNVISNLGVLVALFLLNGYLFVFCFIRAILSFLIEKRRISKAYKIQKDLKKLKEKATSLTSEIVRGVRDIKVLHAEKTVLEQSNQKIHDVSNQQLKKTIIQRRYNLLSNVISSAWTFLFLLLGCYLCTKNLLTIPAFVIAYNYQWKVDSLLSGISHLLEYLKKFQVSATRVFEIVEDDTFQKERFGEKHLDHVSGNIEFSHVSFSYQEDKPIIKDMSFSIRANETVAFVGKSGAGKTTIFSLLTKLYHISEGDILI